MTTVFVMAINLPTRYGYSVSNMHCCVITGVCGCQQTPGFSSSTVLSGFLVGTRGFEPPNRQLNEKPRKTPGYQSPAERFSKCVTSIGWTHRENLREPITQRRTLNVISPVSGLMALCNSVADRNHLKKGCKRCSWPTAAIPPMTNPLYQKRKPISILNSET